MPIQKNQQLWKMRKRHGRPKIFETSEDLWKAACKYFEWCDSNPLVVEDVIRSGDNAGNKIYFNKTRPYTMTGLCMHIGASSSYFSKLKNRSKNNEAAADFSEVVDQVESIIYTQKFEGAAAGFFNANIIARDLGLRDKKELDHKSILAGKDLEDYLNGLAEEEYVD